MRETTSHGSLRARRPAAPEAIVVDPVVAGTAILGLLLALLILLPAPPQGGDGAPGPRIEAAQRSFP